MERCTAGSGRGPLEKDPPRGNLASGLPVLVHGCDGDGPEVELTAALALVPGGMLRMAVADPGRGKPEIRRADEDATSGRGLLLVAALVDRMGVDEGPEGKVVWAEVDLPEAGGGTPAAVTGRHAELQIAVRCADFVVRTPRPRSVTGATPGLDRIPA
ncbi:ATP-binding protein [Kitasatospora sp. NPDC094011]|uniref:ATP-binding protein n=1 Tax=Kitasatospora sp. NPDC094011 TaxID=3364090 RepID=UPI003812544E